MGFSSCDDSDVFQWPKLVSIGRSYSEPFSHLHRPPGSMPTCTPFCALPCTLHAMFFLHPLHFLCPGTLPSLSHGPWVGKFFFLGKTPTCCPYIRKCWVRANRALRGLDGSRAPRGLRA